MLLYYYPANDNFIDFQGFLINLFVSIQLQQIIVDIYFYIATVNY